LHRSPFFSIIVSWFSSLEDRYPMRCIPIRPAPTISVLIGWGFQLVQERQVIVEGVWVRPSNKLPFSKGPRKRSARSTSQQDSAKTNPLSQSKPSFAYTKCMRETNWKNAANQAILAVIRQTRAESTLYLSDLA
jgi:hypothetical protein